MKHHCLEAAKHFTDEMPMKAHLRATLKPFHKKAMGIRKAVERCQASKKKHHYAWVEY